MNQFYGEGAFGGELISGSFNTLPALPAAALKPAPTTVPEKALLNAGLFSSKSILLSVTHNTPLYFLYY